MDLHQNRSHDTFAVLVGIFGSAFSSFGIVAHSQGGAASIPSVRLSLGPRFYRLREIHERRELRRRLPESRHCWQSSI